MITGTIRLRSLVCVYGPASVVTEKCEKEGHFHSKNFYAACCLG